MHNKHNILFLENIPQCAGLQYDLDAGGADYPSHLGRLMSLKGKPEISVGNQVNNMSSIPL